MLIEFGVTFLLNFSLLLKAELIIELVLYLLLVEQTNMFYLKIRWLLKDTHKAKTPSNKTETYTKSIFDYVYLGNCHIKSTIYKRVIYSN